MGKHTYMLMLGDCGDHLRTLPSSVADLIIFSPPYGMQRASTYGGIACNEYTSWFLPISGEMMRILGPTGSMVINIKEHVENGARHPYVADLLSALREQGWKLIDEYIWTKPNPFPGKWPNRFRDGFERIYHFAIQTSIKMRQDAVRVPIGDWAKTDSKGRRQTSRVNKHFSADDSKWVDKKFVYPTNVLQIPVGRKNYGHPAIYPIELPSFFIKLLTDPGDLVLDPFAGSGTTGVAARILGRDFIGIDIVDKYIQITSTRIKSASRQKEAA